MEIVLDVSRRNGGALDDLDWGASLMAPELKIDSMDLAEIVARLERVFRISPFDAPEAPKTWGELKDILLAGQS